MDECAMDVNDEGRLENLSPDKIGLIVTVIALVLGVVIPLIPGKTDIITILVSLSVLILGVIVFFKIRGHLRAALVYPASLDEIVDTIPRMDLRREFESRIPSKQECAASLKAGKNNQINIIVGSYGVGKSYSARKILATVAHEKGYAIGETMNNVADEREDHDLFMTNEYSSKLTERMTAWLKPDFESDKLLSTVKTPKLIVFDQFESLLNQRVFDRINHVRIVKGFLDQLTAETPILLFIIVREEYFFKLIDYFSLDFGRISTLRVSGIPSQDHSAISFIRDRLLDITKDRGISELVISDLEGVDNLVTSRRASGDLQEVQTISPFDVTVVLKSIRALTQLSKGYFKRRQSGVILKYVERLFVALKEAARGGLSPIQLEQIQRGSKENRRTELVSSYLLQFLRNVKNSDIATRILYSLSVAPTSNRALSEEQISRITSLSIEQVHNSLQELTSSRVGLLHKFTDEQTPVYDWKHDYLAEQFSFQSGSLLDPRDRDNINYFWYLDRKDSTVSKSHDVPKDDDPWKYYGFVFFALSICALVIRTFLPSFGTADWESPFDGCFFKPNGFERIDIPFVFILVSLGCWAYYICQTHNRLFIRIQEHSFDRLLTALLPPISFLCVLGTAIPSKGSIPFVGSRYWIMYTGIGGVFVGIKFLQLARTRGRLLLLPFLARRGGLFQKAGWETIVNSTATAAFGCFIYARLFGDDAIVKAGNELGIEIFSLTLWIVMLWFAVGISIKEHASEKMVLLLLSDHKRNEHRA